MIRTIISTTVAIAGALVVSTSAFAGAHTWRVHEVFSTPDGTIQFIELRECCGGSFETFIGGLNVTSTSNTFTFPSNISGDTANAHLLLATSGFANLPGAPTPNYIIPDNFFNPSCDTIGYNNNQYDSWVVGPLPDNCIDSIHRDLGIAPNSPTNFAGDTAAGLDACPGPVCDPDISGDGNVGVPDLLAVINNWGPCPAPCDADIAPPGGDGNVGVPDLLAVINGWGPCP